MGEIVFKYKFEDNYNPIYINGAYGGIGPGGEFVINFYLERQPVPRKVTHVLKEDHGLGDIIETIPPDLSTNVIRYITNGVIMSKATAKAIAKWLNDVLEEKEETPNDDE